ncbi:MAG: filamentous hemagglutinin N-terminal domain-containing protein, partial [Planctomycetes bacterium]|nr:filamentous hemagglutinin N-terminal domain-containing protein [Planctomycetota bacterium]
MTIEMSSKSGSTSRFVKLAVAALTAVVAVAVCQALAGPKGAKVARGKVEISQDGKNTTIKASRNSIINYSSFDIGSDEAVEFVQPSRKARVLNRIRDTKPTRIDGSLRANGIVYFVNPAGMIFGPGAVINVGKLFAAAANISNRDFVNNVNRFTDAKGAVANYGQIYADAAHLIGRHVANYGTITGENGVVMMLAGDEVYIGERGGRMLVRLEGEQAAEAGKPGVENAGTIRATQGVRLAAGDMFSIAVQNTGTIRSKDITIDGGAKGVVAISGTLDASDRTAGGVGGTVKVLGEKVGLFDAKIDASGTAGGGTVLVGGDFQGKGDVPAATATYVGPEAQITADAESTGNGGKVIVWADELTKYYGSISATGGPEGGNGGFAEVSGKKFLAFDGMVDVSATAGLAGTLLLDPYNITIQNGAGNMDGGASPFESTAALNTISDDRIETLLEGGSNVTIQTGAGGAEDGDITQNNDAGIDIDSDPGSPVTLTLQALNDITLGTIVGGGVNVTAGSVNVVLTAVGDVTINAAMNTNGGTFDSTGVNFESTITGGIDTAGGDATINHSGDVTIGGSLAAGTGTIDIDAGGTFNLNTLGINTDGPVSIGAPTLNVNALLQTSGDTTGAVDLTGDILLKGVITTIHSDITFTGNVTVGAGGGTVSTAGDGAGDITITGTLKADDAANLREIVLSTGTGGVQLQGDVGGIGGGDEEPQNVTIVADTIDIQAVRTLGLQVYTGDTTLNGDLTSATAGDITVTGDATLGQNLTITAAGAVGDDITFTGTIDGGQSLDLVAA